MKTIKIENVKTELIEIRCRVFNEVKPNIYDPEIFELYKKLFKKEISQIRTDKGWLFSNLDDDYTNYLINKYFEEDIIKFKN